MKMWENNIKPMLGYLRDIVNFIPEEVAIPPKKKFKNYIQYSSPQTTITENPRKPVYSEVELIEARRLLINLDLSKKDAVYLEDYRDKLIKVLSTLDEDFLVYLKSMVAHFDFGQKLLDLFSEDDSKRFAEEYKEISTSFVSSPYNAMRRVLEDASAPPGGTEISLARILRTLTTSKERNMTHAFASNPWLPRWQTLAIPPSAPPAPTEAFEISDRIDWMLGRLSVRDLSIAQEFLIIRNPKFSPMGLADAEIKDKRGRSNFSIAVDRLTFTVDKPRAGVKKITSLDGDSLFVISGVLRMTAHTRASMDTDNPLKKQLFYLQDARGARPPNYTAMHGFFRDKNRQRTEIFLPRTTSSQLITSTLTPMKIRATNAVLEWFKTGSVSAAARLIGNTTKVVIEHYIPSVLLEAWNRRLIRRFHNLVLCAASAGEDYLLECTDFHTAEDLNAFITDMLKQHSSSSSKLASIMHRSFANSETAEDAHEPISHENSSLIIPIGTNVLTALYVYRDCMYKKSKLEQNAFRGGGDTGLDPCALVDLADLLNTRLPAHENPDFRAAHNEAMLAASHFSSDFTQDANPVMYSMVD
jgi:hypothetical protein